MGSEYDPNCLLSTYVTFLDRYNRRAFDSFRCTYILIFQRHFNLYANTHCKFVCHCCPNLIHKHSQHRSIISNIHNMPYLHLLIYLPSNLHRTSMPSRFNPTTPGCIGIISPSLLHIRVGTTFLPFFTSLISYNTPPMGYFSSLTGRVGRCLLSEWNLYLEQQEFIFIAATQALFTFIFTQFTLFHAPFSLYFSPHISLSPYSHFFSPSSPFSDAVSLLYLSPS